MSRRASSYPGAGRGARSWMRRRASTRSFRRRPLIASNNVSSSFMITSTIALDDIVEQGFDEAAVDRRRHPRARAGEKCLRAFGVRARRVLGVTHTPAAFDQLQQKLNFVFTLRAPRRAGLDRRAQRRMRPFGELRLGG